MGTEHFTVKERLQFEQERITSNIHLIQSIIINLIIKIETKYKRFR